MRTYIARRFLQVVPLLFGISALTFLLLQLAPGDFLNQMAENPAISADTIDAMRQRFGLDKPWYVQYGLYLRNVLLHFDFGQSFSRHQPVFTVLREGLLNTLLLASAAAVVTWVLAIPLGVSRRSGSSLGRRPVAPRLRLVGDTGDSSVCCPDVRRADRLVSVGGPVD
jgi:peptide/nickel transport system permease protein